MADVNSSESFDALRNFVRGYLHQDTAVVHGSSDAAVRQFLRDAGPHDIRQVATEWRTFLATHSADVNPLDEINRHFEHHLGGGWRFTSMDEVQRLTSALEETEQRPETKRS
jgi:hypothetical protein